jgi:hypothetical protein
MIPCSTGFQPAMSAELTLATHEICRQIFVKQILLRQQELRSRGRPKKINLHALRRADWQSALQLHIYGGFLDSLYYTSSIATPGNSTAPNRFYF